MAKIMLVEDDNNLREIYQARLAAEGFEIICAGDGEEALALAVKEKPDLIISDVMMPKISGFDMLDILRSTPETKDTKVIMMTALSQAEDKDRASKLGADHYLVKSQVTLEDVAKVARETLEGITSAPAQTNETTPESTPVEQPAPVTEAPVEPVIEAPVVTPEPVVSEAPPAPEPVVEAPVVTPEPSEEQPSEEIVTGNPTVTASVATTLVAETPVTTEGTLPPVAVETPVATPEPVVSEAPPAPEPVVEAPTTTSINVTTPEETTSESDEMVKKAVDNMMDTTTAPEVPATEPTTEVTSTPVTVPVVETPDTGSSDSMVHKKVIQPLNDINATKPDIQALLAEEEQNIPVATPPADTVVKAQEPAIPQTSAPATDPNSIAL